MRNPLIDIVEQSHRKAEVPVFRIGDTVVVSVRIVEGEKERVQNFTGVVIARRGAGLTEMFTVRRIVNNEGVERIFPIHSPKVLGVEVLRSGRVRRAKLFFLRHRVGKARKLRERRVVHGTRAALVAGAKKAAEAESHEKTETQLAGV